MELYRIRILAHHNNIFSNHFRIAPTIDKYIALADILSLAYF